MSDHTTPVEDLSDKELTLLLIEVATLQTATLLSIVNDFLRLDKAEEWNESVDRYNVAHAEFVRRIEG